MGNVISSVRGSTVGWWNSEHRKAILDSSDVSPHNPVPPIAEKARRDVNHYSESEYLVESDNELDESVRSRILARTLSPQKAKELAEFRKELAIKRKARVKLISEKSNEMEALREALKEEKRLREEAVDENTALRALIAANTRPAPDTNESAREADSGSQEHNRMTGLVEELEKQVTEVRELNRTIRWELSESNYALQGANTETALLNKENFELKNQITALKEVKKVSKEMLEIRETQLKQLKDKLNDIEKSLADREMRTLSDDLKREYERQLENIRNLRILYEERARVAEITRRNLQREVDEHKILAEGKTTKCAEFEARIEHLEKELADKNEVLGATLSQLGYSKAETKELQSEMTVINQLFSQMLLGQNSNQDLDKLLLKLEENHDLLADMVVREDCSEMSSALPKLILDLVNQVDASDIVTSVGDIRDGENNANVSEEGAASSSKSLTSAKEIVGNLPKVWRVLTELLSHQSGPPLVVSEISDKSSINCYKSVETPSGPRMVPSVSKTYIRLKDLILEKKSLQKEMNRLKQLNSHLENRLQDQGRRLGLVSSELGKTWHVVGRMERQHQQLHTHEKILRYELQQKRKLLTELKEELEYCKDKWDRAKQKNCESQIEWDKLRIEFASRKIKSNESINNSVESGYSDERVSDEDSDVSDGGIVSERKRLKKKSKSAETDGVEIATTKDAEEAVDSDLLQDEDVVSNDGIEVTSEGEIQATLADNEDQSVSEVLSKSGENSEEESTVNSLGEPVASSSSSTPNNGTCYDDVLATRSARLKKLEEQCYVLVNKVTKTKIKGVQLCTRLEELHNQYGGDGRDQPSTSTQTTTEEDRNTINDRLESSGKDTNVSQEEILPILIENQLITDATATETATDETVNENRTERVTDETENETRTERVTDETVKENRTERVTDETVNENRTERVTDETENRTERVTDETVNENRNERVTDETVNENRTERVTDETVNENRTERVTDETVNENRTERVTDEAERDETESDVNESRTDSNNRLHCITEDLVEEEIKTLLKENTSELTTSERLLDESVEENGLDTKVNETQLGAEYLTEICEESIPRESTTDTEKAPISSVARKSCISDFESRFAARDERLKRMEEQAKSLVNKVSNTSNRSVAICSRLDELHNTYSKSEEQTDGVPDKFTSDSQPSTSNITNGETLPDNMETEKQTSINNSPEQRIEEQK